MANVILETILNTSQKSPGTLCFDDQLKLGNTLTYGDLEAQSNRLATYFATHFQRSEPILVYGGFSKEMLVAFIACQKAGHPYVPVDEKTPVERIELIHAEAKPTAVLAFAPWELPNIQALSQTDVAEIINESIVTADLTPITGAELIYIIFTSGTTGKPKGVQISYENLNSFCQWMLADFALANEQRFLCQAPFSFDLSVMDLYPALLTAGTLVPLHKETADDLAMLFKTLPSLGLNVWVSTPSMVEICLLSPDFNEAKLPGLSRFLFCGEELPRPVAEKLASRFPTAKIFNTFGPTEATVAVTGVEITPDILLSYDRLPLGSVKPGSEIIILDDAGQVLGEKQRGEIVVVGPTVSRGYLNNPEKTMEAFFTYQGQPAYRTGDEGYLENGQLFYQGRLDFQIKWHGYRMELGDIDHHLTTLSEVRNACVVPKYKDFKVQQLIAYVALTDGVPVEGRKKAKELKNQLQDKLMSYMIPQKFVFLEQLPLTANGKIDRKQLMNEVNGQ